MSRRGYSARLSAVEAQRRPLPRRTQENPARKGRTRRPSAALTAPPRLPSLKKENAGQPMGSAGRGFCGGKRGALGAGAQPRKKPTVGLSRSKHTRKIRTKVNTQQQTKNRWIHWFLEAIMDS